ncbi:response regulator [Halomicroarcula sp. GCM10025710]
MPITILHVDDDSAVRDLLADVVEVDFEGVDVLSAPDVATAVDLLESEAVDCIVSDYEMPDVDGLDFFERVRADDVDLPFILFTGRGTERTASQAISAGVTDYVRKEAGSDQYAVLMDRVEKAVRARREERAQDRREQQFEMLAELSQDALEGQTPTASPTGWSPKSRTCSRWTTRRS